MPQDPIKALETIIAKIDRQVGSVINKYAFQIRRRVSSSEFLKWRTRRRPIVVEKSKVENGIMTAYVRAASRWKYAHVHIGQVGTTTITAKNGFLAIPTDAANKFIRTRRAGPKHYGGLVIIDGIMYGRANWSGTGGYVRQHRAAGEKFTRESLVPMFILKKSITVRRRVIPDYLINAVRPALRADLQQVLNRG